MNKRKIGFGPGAASLILILIVLCMTILAVLGLTTSVRDEKNGIGSARITERTYALYAAAERSLSYIDSILAEYGSAPDDKNECINETAKRLPEGMTITGDIIRWTEKDNDGRLECGVRLWPDTGGRTEWVDHRIIFGETEADTE